MVDPTADNAGDAPPAGPRHHEGTINEAGTPGFAVDGTDSFAVPDPTEGLSPSAEGAAATPWRRTLVTLGAVVTLLAVAVILGATGRDRADSMQTTSGTTASDFTLPAPFGGPAGGRRAATSGSDETALAPPTTASYSPYVTSEAYAPYQYPSVTATTADPYRGSNNDVPRYWPYIPPSRIVSPVTTRTTPRTWPTTPTTPPPAPVVTTAPPTVTTSAPATTVVSTTAPATTQPAGTSSTTTGPCGTTTTSTTSSSSTSTSTSATTTVATTTTSSGGCATTTSTTSTTPSTTSTTTTTLPEPS